MSASLGPTEISPSPAPPLPSAPLPSFPLPSPPLLSPPLPSPPLPSPPRRFLEQHPHPPTHPPTRDLLLPWTHDEDEEDGPASGIWNRGRWAPPRSLLSQSLCPSLPPSIPVPRTGTLCLDTHGNPTDCGWLASHPTQHPHSHSPGARHCPCPPFGARRRTHNTHTGAQCARHKQWLAGAPGRESATAQTRY